MPTNPNYLEGRIDFRIWRSDYVEMRVSWGNSVGKNSHQSLHCDRLCAYVCSALSMFDNSARVLYLILLGDRGVELERRPKRPMSYSRHEQRNSPASMPRQKSRPRGDTLGP
jgi:hypothetical protein